MAKSISKLIIALLTILLVAIWAEIARSPVDGNVHLYFLNVGQGDSELIERGDFQILIDGGPDDSVLSQIGEVMPLGDRKIDIMILTHPHADHLVGLNQILGRYEVGTVYFSGVAHTSNQYLEFLNLLKQNHINSVVPNQNDSIVTIPGSTLTFLWPGERFSGQSSCSAAEDSNQTIKSTGDSACVENLNNTSEVVKFCYSGQCALLMGDLQTDGQAEMFANNKTADFQAKLLKIAHHGSSNGTDQALLDRVQPKYAVIEVGADNKYGHPHASTLDLLDKAGIKYWRTDRDAAIEFILSPTDTTLAP